MAPTSFSKRLPGMDDSETAAAFSRGCDARLAGVPYGACPHRGAGDAKRRKYWQLGWLDMHLYWPHPLLPASGPVRQPQPQDVAV